MSYGNRYLEIRNFIRYCTNLKVKTDETELEYYEEKGIMLPVARVVLPEEYIKRTSKARSSGSSEMPLPEEWPEANQLYDRLLIVPQHYAELPDEELVDSFDRAFDRNHPYLVRPEPGHFKPWDSYRVVVEHQDDYDIDQSTATHYYSYWQVHQLYDIQKYPDLYENRLILSLLSGEEERYWLPRALNLDIYRDFHARARFFDALSFYITMYHREQGRTFALIPERHRLRTLDKQQYKHYVERLSAHAKFVCGRYSLNEQHLYTFLIQLLQLRSDYIQAERLRLAAELENDITYQARLTASITGKDLEEIGNEIGKIAPFWVKREFRHIHLPTKERDEAEQVLFHYTNKMTQDFAKNSIQPSIGAFSEKEISGLLNFCEGNGLTLFPYTLSELLATEDEASRKFRRLTLYGTSKNLATCLEYFLKAIASRFKNTLPSRATLTRVVQTLMTNETGWIPLFEQRTSCLSGEDPAEFLSNLTRLLNDHQLAGSEDGFWARCFLISCLARNLTVHNYPTDDWFYGDLYGVMLRALLYSFFYSWHVAKREGWV